MRISKKLLISVMCILCLFSSCGIQNTTATASKNQTKTTKANIVTKEEQLEWRNYHNHYTAEDKDYIYYIDAYGLYKISKSDNKKEKLIDLNLGFFLTLHGDYIYFVTSDGLNRIRKDGQDYYFFKNITSSNYILKCIDDVLYMSLPRYDSIYSYNIKDDPTELNIICKNVGISDDIGNIPYPNGKIYSTEKNGESNVLFASNVNGKNKKKLLNDVIHYFVDYNNLYYINMDGKLITSDLNGMNSKILYKSTMNMQFISFDGEWIYIYNESNNYKFSRLNIKTKEIQSLDALKDYNQTYFDVAGGYIFIKEKGVMKYIKSDGTGALDYIK